jgi:hypothetical protein
MPVGFGRLWRRWTRSEVRPLGLVECLYQVEVPPALPGGSATVVGYMIRGFDATGQTTAMRWYRLKQQTPPNNEFIDMPPSWLALRQVDPGAGQQVHFMGWVGQPDPV